MCPARETGEPSGMTLPLTLFGKQATAQRSERSGSLGTRNLRKRAKHESAFEATEKDS
jgi:hypothetical protein